jgi:outer membrane protein
MRKRALTPIFLAALALPASAEDLLQVYRDAQRYDAVFSAARRSLEATREKLPQGRALLLPTLNLTANATRNRFESEPHDSTVTALEFSRNTLARGYILTFTQPLIKLQAVSQYDQAGFQVKQAEATFGQAAQDLILRVAQAYFDVLAARDSLALVGAQKAAISEQLAQAKRNFEVGTATITDTHEAQARFDLSAAQEIAAQNELENKRQALQLLTGKDYAQLQPLRADVKLAQPNPPDMQNWVELAEKQSYPVQIQEAAREIAALELKRNYAAHAPTLDFVAQRQYTNQTGTATTSFGNELTTTTLGLQLSMPLFRGGDLFSRDREAAALAEKAKDDLNNARRTSVLTTRQSYLSVINGITQIGALEQARVSSQSALDSNKLGYEVGVRINIDVLNAQQQLFSTQRDLSVARYNTITNYLRLKAAAGSLVEQDIEEVNRVLAP